MSALIQSLEAAEGGSRELDVSLGQALGIIDADRIYTARDGLRMGRGNCEPWPRWTTSLDAALALAERVLPGISPGVSKNVFHGYWSAWLHQNVDGACYLVGDASASPTPALALCTANLRAKEGGQ